MGPVLDKCLGQHCGTWPPAFTHHLLVSYQFASKADKPLVEIYVADEWIRPEQAVVKYKMAAGFHRSSWDWIGLYRVGAEVLCSVM